MCATTFFCVGDKPLLRRNRRCGFIHDACGETMNTLNFTFNFNAPVGQDIAHVDTFERKDMTMQVMDMEVLVRRLEIIRFVRCRLSIVNKFLYLRKLFVNLR